MGEQSDGNASLTTAEGMKARKVEWKCPRLPSNLKKICQGHRETLNQSWPLEEARNGLALVSTLRLGKGDKYGYL